MECLLPYLCMVTVPHIMVRLERMLDYRGFGLERFHCICTHTHTHTHTHRHTHTHTETHMNRVFCQKVSDLDYNAQGNAEHELV